MDISISSGIHLPFISIIMVSYNQGALIEQSIQSVLNQNYSNFELIVIDGESSDQSIVVINKYTNKIKKVIIEKDRGMYHARNKGIMLATGDYIGFLNSDDLYYPDALKNISNLIIKENYPDMVFGYTIGLTKEGKELIKIVFGPNLDISKKTYFKKMKTIPDQSTFYKKEALAFIGLYDTSLRFGADTDLKCRFVKNDMKICSLTKIIAGWRIYEEALTYRPDLRNVRFKESVMINHRYTGSYMNYYTVRLFLYNFIVPSIKRFLKYFRS